jgi:hypothetical protein
MQQGKFTPDLIAPCGMNCGICKRYLAYSRGVPKSKGKVIHCQGCLPSNRNCYIKRGCRKILGGEIRFCFECDELICENLNHLDKRYRERYGMSMVENLKEINCKGVEKFLDSQENRYRCSNCGDVFSVHDGKCYKCGHDSPKEKT